MIWLPPKWQLSVLTAVGEKKAQRMWSASTGTWPNSKGERHAKHRKPDIFAGFGSMIYFRGTIRCLGNVYLQSCGALGQIAIFFSISPIHHQKQVEPCGT
jgi:hypothetical protein